MKTDIHHLHTNTEPSHTGSLTASCSNWPGSGPYTHESLSNQGSLLALHSSILFHLYTSLSFLFLCVSSPVIIEGFLLLFCVVPFLDSGSGSSGEKHHTHPPSPFPSLCSKQSLVSSLSALPLSPFLSLWFSQGSSPLSSSLHLVFPSHSVTLPLSVCTFHLPPSLSLSQ